jgi:hypothetical protein
MPTVYQLNIKGDLHEAEHALRQHGFSAKDWRVVSGTAHEIIVHVDSHHVDKSLMVTMFNTWFTENWSVAGWPSNRMMPAGSLLFWKPFEPSDATGYPSAAPRRGPKIIDDLDGVEDNAKRAPLWATVRGRY